MNRGSAIRIKLDTNSTTTGLVADLPRQPPVRLEISILSLNQEIEATLRGADI